MKTTVTRFIHMIVVLDFIDKFYLCGLAVIHQTCNNKRDQNKFNNHCINIRQIINHEKPTFEKIDKHLFQFVYICLLYHFKNKSCWDCLKKDLQDGISKAMEEKRDGMDDYTYIYNSYKNAIDLIEEFYFTYPFMTDYEITENREINIKTNIDMMYIVGDSYFT